MIDFISRVDDLYQLVRFGIVCVWREGERGADITINIEYIFKSRERGGGRGGKR